MPLSLFTLEFCSSQFWCQVGVLSFINSVWYQRAKKEILKIYTVSRSKRFLALCKKVKEGTNSEWGGAVIQQFIRHWTDHVSILRNIMTQAQIFCEELYLQHECEYCQGRLHKLKSRHGIILHHVWGKTKNADTEAVAESVDQFVQFVSCEKLPTQQRYNVSELALTLAGFLQKHLHKKLRRYQVALRNLKTAQLFLIAVMHIGSQTTKVFLQRFENHFNHETRAQCKLVGPDSKHKTVLLFDNCYLPECIPACQT
jgi:hypothetical protein